MKASVKKHYHWIIVAAVLLELFVYGGICNNLNSLFVIPVTEGLGISRTSFSFAWLLKSIISFAGALLSGMLLRQFGYRKCVGTLLITGALGLILLSCSKDVFMLCVGAGIVGFSDGACMTAGPSRIINSWFYRHRGTVLGCVTAATGLGGSVICIVLTGIMEKNSWQTAYFFDGILLLFMSLLIWLVIKDRPENMGLKPYGEGTPNSKQQKTKNTQWEGYSLKELYRKPSFYMMLAGTALSCFLAYMPFMSAVPHLQDCGLSQQQATLMQSVMLLALAASKLLAGVLCDKIGAKLVTVLCLVSTLLCLVCMTAVSNLLTATVSMILLAMALPLTALVVPLLTTEVFGYKGQTTAIGICVSMVQIGGMVAGPVVQSTFDTLGSYRPAYWAGAIGTVLVICLYLVMYWLAEKDKKKHLAMQK